MANAQDQIPRHLRRPGDDGYRTPMIEDTERYLTISSYFPPVNSSDDALSYHNLELYRHQSVGEAHVSALERVNSLALRPNWSRSSAANNGDLNPSSKENGEPVKLGFKQRIRHMTWVYFTLTMATGGIANVLYNIPEPFRFNGLDAIGIVIFLLNIALYIMIWGLLLIRFICFPYTFKASFLHPTESLFVPATVVSFGTILINISQYGPDRTGPWLLHAVNVLFWFDFTLAFCLSAGVYLLLWSTQTFTIAQMTPIWIFPAYPMLIVGPHAGVLSAQLSPRQSFYIILGGFTIQGVGFLVSLMVYSAFIYRLMTQKLPKENIRPGMFVSVGPSAFTAAGTVNMAANAERVFPSDLFGNGPLVAMIVQVVANFSCLWLWGLAIFWFFIATSAHILPVMQGGRMVFSMTWFSFVFPNTALITATFAIGKVFSCRPIEIAGLVMTVLLIIVYIFVVYMMIRAIVLHHILWPQKGEDKDEGGFRIAEIKPKSPRRGPSPV
ncbi:voltage-dependent anion channel-domain-containing protein [Talaromyces proteolyticus]|uniref:Voltage-dependent anion channel-domain-containing protein n=1 Tax=Talaromyces proteolyticus TaxID=1131652 RepID=A0AAD4PW26_9EURO|nr:voltage-dependent anion channel-domain-containing protein [Talaromyces proteolyticus]KAH8690955.1 voltage-dependent anion channel-domain-containing protein [Talaromyces proteolyticus]